MCLVWPIPFGSLLFLPTHQCPVSPTFLDLLSHGMGMKMSFNSMFVKIFIYFYGDQDGLTPK